METWKIRFTKAEIRQGVKTVSKKGEKSFFEVRRQQALRSGLQATRAQTKSIHIFALDSESNSPLKSFNQSVGVRPTKPTNRK